MSSTRTRILAAAAAVAVVAAGGLLAWRYLADDDGRPVVTVTSAGETVAVPPLRYCDLAELREAFLQLSEWEATGERTVAEEPEELFERICDTSDTPALITVEPGSPVTVKLPKEIADAPWSLLTMYQGASPEDTGGGVDVHRPGETSEVTLDPVDAEGRALTVVEVRLPAGIIDPETGVEDFISHATWAVNAR